MEIKPPCHNRLRDYDPLLVQKTWEDSIELDVDLKGLDPFYAQSNIDYNNNAIGKATKAMTAVMMRGNRNDAIGNDGLSMPKAIGSPPDDPIRCAVPLR